jgi:hypothetical protein
VLCLGEGLLDEDGKGGGNKDVEDEGGEADNKEANNEPDNKPEVKVEEDDRASALCDIVSLLRV